MDEDDIKPFRIRYYLEKRDPEFAEKMKEVIMMYKEIRMGVNSEEDTGMVTLSFDEKPGIHAAGNTADDRPVSGGHGFVGRDSEYVRHETVRLLAGLDLMSGQIVPLVSETHKSSIS